MPRKDATIASPTMSLEMLPALHGDALLLHYGPKDGRQRRLLIDGGPIGAWAALRARVQALPSGDRHFELVVLTHVDTDHVDGLIRLFAERTPWPFSVGQVWFNGWRQLAPQHGLLGGKQGEYFSALLAHRLKARQWNAAFGGEAVVVPEYGPLPEKSLDGGLRLTLLSPTPRTLEAMRKAWAKDIKGSILPGDLESAWQALTSKKRYLPRQGLLGSTPALDALLEQQSRPDNSAANGSSIALLAEYEGKRVLLLGDAHPEVVTSSLRLLLAQRGLDRLAVDAVKVAHHGSKANTSDELMALIDSPRYLISTNGDQFSHPDSEAVQRIISRTQGHPLTLYFNYRSAFNEAWADPERQKTLGYTTVYRERDAGEDDLTPIVVRW